MIPSFTRVIIISWYLLVRAQGCLAIWAVAHAPPASHSPPTRPNWHRKRQQVYSSIIECCLRVLCRLPCFLIMSVYCGRGRMCSWVICRLLLEDSLRAACIHLSGLSLVMFPFPHLSFVFMYFSLQSLCVYCPVTVHDWKLEALFCSSQIIVDVSGLL